MTKEKVYCKDCKYAKGKKYINWRALCFYQKWEGDQVPCRDKAYQKSQRNKDNNCRYYVPEQCKSHSFCDNGLLFFFLLLSFF